MPLMQEDGVGLGGDAHAAKPGRQHLQGGDLHPAEVFAVGVGGGADDAIGVLTELPRQGKQGAEVAPLASEVPLLEGVVTAQPPEEHGAALFDANGG